MTIRYGVLLLAILLLGGCVTAEKKDYTAFRQSDPHSVLVVPVINRSVDVDAPDYFLATISKPLAERGYYVFPVHMVKRIMEDEGLSDADMVHKANPTRLAALFDADSVLYISINQWDAKYMVLSTTVTVDFSYRLVDGETGIAVWQSQRKLQYSPNSGSGGGLIGLAAQAAVAAIERAKPRYIPLARQANAEAVAIHGVGVPAGPHHPDYGEDVEAFPTASSSEGS